MRRKASNYVRDDLIYIGFLGLVMVLVSLAGCGLPSGEDPELDRIPGEPGEPIVIVEDTRSDGDQSIWMTQYVIGGGWADAWFTNQYERPFTAFDMTYQPHLDIQEARIRLAGDWIVFEIQAHSPAAGERVYISLEIDTNLDNRPDLLILTRELQDTTWNDGMISILVDPNRDAGGNRPRLAEPFDDNWNGFEDSLNTDGSKAFIRRSPDTDSAYQIAVSNELLPEELFIWRVWLEGEIFHPGWVEYNDRVSLADAGSPYLYSPNYPLKALASLDNTCLQFYGGEAVQPQPGFCGTIIDLSGEETLPPDDQFVNPEDENPVLIIFPSPDPEDGSDDPEPILMVFDPGVFFQPTPTPRPNLSEIPTMEFDVPPQTQEGSVLAVVITQYMAEAVVVTPETLYGVPVPTAMGVGVVEETEMFDPYAGSTQPPTEMFDPYQGSSPTPKPIIFIPLQTPTPTARPIIHLNTVTPP